MLNLDGLEEVLGGGGDADGGADRGQSARRPTRLTPADISGRPLGRRALTAGITRPLGEEDLLLLATERADKTHTGPPPLQRIRAVHHQVARLLASGMKSVDVAVASGITPEYVHVLKSDPAFAELLAHYSGAEQDRFIDVQERMKTLGVMAAEVLQDRILESETAWTNKDLMALLTTALDRGGHSPVQRHEAKVMHFSPEALQKIKNVKEASAHVSEDIQALLGPGSASSALPPAEADRPAREGAGVRAEGREDGRVAETPRGPRLVDTPSGDVA